jgi:hypothetical protein
MGLFNLLDGLLGFYKRGKPVATPNIGMRKKSETCVKNREIQERKIKPIGEKTKEKKSQERKNLQGRGEPRALPP